MMDPNVSFVILTWNSERCVAACLESVLSLGKLCFEIHVVDNGSTDRTLSIVRRIADGDCRVIVRELKKNLGTTVPRNMALRELSPDATHVCILDSDTIVNRLAFDDMLAVLNSDVSIGVVGPTMTSPKGDVQLSGRNLPTLGIKLGKACPVSGIANRAARLEEPATPVVDGLQDVGYLLSACWLMPVGSMSAVGLLDEKIFYAPEDVDWCLRCHKEGLRVVRDHRVSIVHEYQRVGHKKLLSRVNYEHMKGLAHYYRKHGYILHAPTYGK